MGTILLYFRCRVWVTAMDVLDLNLIYFSNVMAHLN